MAAPRDSTAAPAPRSPAARRGTTGLPDRRAARRSIGCVGRRSWRPRLTVRRPALLRKQSARPTLDEQDQEHQHEYLRQHRARIRLEELIDDAERVAAQFSAPQITDATEHHHHERVDDIALAEVRADVGELAQR